jgi:enhancing lycopene biosynthesis protein 2
MKKVAGVLAGCGFLDGTEIQEAVLTLFSLEKRGVAVEWFAPHQPQHHVVNHASGEPAARESRDVLAESARIVRGAVRPLSELDMGDYDGLVVPGGFGAAKNLCTFAFEGAQTRVLPELEAQILLARETRKPMGFICIAPVIAARVLARAGRRPLVTIGDHKESAAVIRSWGAQHQDCAADELCADADNLLLSTPAWNAARSITQVAAGIDLLAGRLARMI